MTINSLQRPHARTHRSIPALLDKNGNLMLFDSVIGLPEKLFYGTGISATILIFRKSKTDKKCCSLMPAANSNPARTRTC